MFVVTNGAATAATAASSPPACSDGAFNIASFKWTTPYAWRFRAGSTPATNSKSSVEQALQRAASGITTGSNSCQLTSALDATHQYLGRTTRGVNIVSKTTSYKCGQRDGQNVVGFGPLPKGILGVACVWFTNVALEADVRLNDRGYGWFANNVVPSGCRSAFSVEGVATHEMGHVFGLSHVSEATHANLTMSTTTRPCTRSDVTLGKGDVLGLRAKYGR